MADDPTPILLVSGTDLDLPPVRVEVIMRGPLQGEQGTVKSVHHDGRVPAPAVARVLLDDGREYQFRSTDLKVVHDA